MVNNGLLDQKNEALAFLGSNEVIQFGQNDIVPAGSSLIMAMSTSEYKIALPFGGSGANKDKVVTIYFSFNTEKGGNIFNQLNEHIDARHTKILTGGRELSISDLFSRRFR